MNRWELCKKLELDTISKWYICKPESDLETQIFFWDFEIKSDHLIQARIADYVSIDEKK